MVELESKADAPNEDDGINGEPFVAGENAENPDGENAVDGDNQPDGIGISNPEENLEVCVCNSPLEVNCDNGKATRAGS